MLQRGTDEGRRLGAVVIERLLAAKSRRSEVWHALSDVDQEIMTIWLGLPRSPLQRRDRQRRAASVLDLDARAVQQLLHEPASLLFPPDPSSVPPFGI